MDTFDCELKQQIIYGDNTIERLGELTRSLGGSRVLVTTDPGIEKAGILARAVSALQSERIAAYVYADVTSNPTTEDVEAAVTVAKTNAPIDLIIGLGGGSSMDCAKGANFLLTNNGEMADYWGTNKATEPMLPSIGIPTTIGTGSEAQSFALISQPDTHIKMACGDKKSTIRYRNFGRNAYQVFAENNRSDPPPMDAVAHAVESYVSNRQQSRCHACSHGTHGSYWMHKFRGMLLRIPNVPSCTQAKCCSAHTSPDLQSKIRCSVPHTLALTHSPQDTMLSTALPSH